MLVYRLSKTIHAGDLEGEGAKLFGGRWNEAGTAGIYTSESRALAILEFSVNVPLINFPKDLSITAYEIPENLFIPLNSENLPNNWQESPSPSSTQILGSSYLLNENILGIKVPSVIVPEEFNYIINPLAKSFKRIKVLNMVEFSYDLWIKR